MAVYSNQPLPKRFARGRTCMCQPQQNWVHLRAIKFKSQLEFGDCTADFIKRKRDLLLGQIKKSYLCDWRSSSGQGPTY